MPAVFAPQRIGSVPVFGLTFSAGGGGTVATLTAVGAIASSLMLGTPTLTAQTGPKTVQPYGIESSTRIGLPLVQAQFPLGYANATHLTDRFGIDELIQLTNPRDPAATAINAVPLDEAIADIDALINAKLSPRYTVPLASVPRVLRNLAADLVRARLYGDRLPEHLAKRETASLKLLDDIQAGRLSLGLDAAQQPTAPVQGPQYETNARVFTPDSLADY